MTRTIRLVERKALQPKYYFFFLPFSEATHGAPSCVGCCFLIRSYSSTRLMSAGDTREKLAPFFLLERFSFTLFSRSFCSFFLRWCLFFFPHLASIKKKEKKKTKQKPSTVSVRPILQKEKRKEKEKQRPSHTNANAALTRRKACEIKKSRTSKAQTCVRLRPLRRQCWPKGVLSTLFLHALLLATLPTKKKKKRAAHPSRSQALVRLCKRRCFGNCSSWWAWQR